jgi:adenylate kinase
MCHLVMDTSNDVQKMAYQMLREAAKKHTEKVVVDAAVDTEGSYKPRLPTELLDILARTVDLHEDSPEVCRHQSDTCCWAQMILFRHYSATC